MIKDSGERREFETGAVRDIQEGKGRFDLVPLIAIMNVFEDYETVDVIRGFAMFMDMKNTEFLAQVLRTFAHQRGWDYPTMMLEVAVHYEEGGTKYGERNWEKGINTHSYVDSALRHYFKWLRGDEDERHDRAFVWNVLGLIWTMKCKPELDDINLNLGADE